MNYAWKLIGRISFWVLWPVQFIYLYPSTRTRVLIVAGGSTLLVKGWIGDGKWELPGGGLHKGEVSTDGAVREVKEETNLVLEPSELKQLAGGLRKKYGLRYKYITYAVQLPSKDNAKRQFPELVDMAWVPLNEIDQKTCDHLVIEALATWRKDQNLVK